MAAAAAGEGAAGGRVLDANCGTGVVAREAATRCAGAAAVTGADVNADMLEAAAGL